MESSTHRSQSDKRRQQEIRRQIKALQAQLSHIPDDDDEVPRSHERKQAGPALLAPSTPSPSGCPRVSNEVRIDLFIRKEASDPTTGPSTQGVDHKRCDSLPRIRWDDQRRWQAICAARYSPGAPQGCPIKRSKEPSQPGSRAVISAGLQ